MIQILVTAGWRVAGCAAEYRSGIARFLAAMKTDTGKDVSLQDYSEGDARVMRTADLISLVHEPTVAYLLLTERDARGSSGISEEVLSRRIRRVVDLSVAALNERIPVPGRRGSGEVDGCGDLGRLQSTRRVLYVAHPIVPTLEELVASNVAGDGREFMEIARNLRDRNLRAALGWVAWLGVSFPGDTFVASPSVARFGLACPDLPVTDVAATDVADVADVADVTDVTADDRALINFCHGVVLTGWRVCGGMRRLLERERPLTYDLTRWRADQGPPLASGPLGYDIAGLIERIGLLAGRASGAGAPS